MCFYFHATEEKIQSFVLQIIYLGNSLPKYVTAAKRLQIPGESGQTYGGEIHCWEEKGGSWLDKPYQAQEIHSAENVRKLCEC